MPLRFGRRLLPEEEEGPPGPPGTVGRTRVGTPTYGEVESRFLPAAPGMLMTAEQFERSAGGRALAPGDVSSLIRGGIGAGEAGPPPPPPPPIEAAIGGGTPVASTAAGAPVAVNPMAARAVAPTQVSGPMGPAVPGAAVAPPPPPPAPSGPSAVSLGFAYKPWETEPGFLGALEGTSMFEKLQSIGKTGEARQRGLAEPILANLETQQLAHEQAPEYMDPYAKRLAEVERLAGLSSGFLRPIGVRGTPPPPTLEDLLAAARGELPPPPPPEEERYRRGGITAF